jgi:pimeloyl-ACP methyl ester carboxylesterase
LQQRSDLGSRIVAGHSEGGLIALQVANRTLVSGVVLLATPGRRFGDVLRDQLQRSAMPAPLRTEALTIIAALERGETVADVNPGLMSLLRPSVQPFMRSILALDPVQEMRALTGPVLIISGGHDLQVGADDAALLAGARPDASRLDMPSMNHVLKITSADPAGQQQAYSSPNLPLAPGLVDAIAGFVHRSAP